MSGVQSFWLLFFVLADTGKEGFFVVVVFGLDLIYWVYFIYLFGFFFVLPEPYIILSRQGVERFFCFCFFFIEFQSLTLRQIKRPQIEQRKQIEQVVFCEKKKDH